MAFGILSFALMAAVLYFAVVGVRLTVANYRETHGLDMFRDLLKYLVLFVSVLITCLGLAGLLGLLLDTQNVDYYSKLDAARWLAFIVVGVPLSMVMTTWIRRDFNRDQSLRDNPTWQIYLLAASTVSLMIWLIPFNTTLRWFVGEPYRPRELAQVIVAFSVWILHMVLIRRHRSVIANIHRFMGTATGLVLSTVGAVGSVSYGIAKWIGVSTKEYELQNALILLASSIPVAIFYWVILDNSASDLELRIYRTFPGKVVPTATFAIAATFTLGKILNWYFGEHINDAPRYFLHSTAQMAMVLVTAPIALYFRHLVSQYFRDDITRIFQYFVSGAALIGAGVAGGWFIAGFFEFNNFVNTSISGFSGLMILLPIWWYEWRHCQFAMHNNFDSEHNNPIRKVFLYVMIWLPTLSAIGAAVSLSYILFKGLLVGGFEWIDIKAPFGALASAAIIAIYQYRVYKSEKVGYAKRHMRLVRTV